MGERRGIEGSIQRYSKRTGRGTIRLIDGRVVIFTARVVERSGIRDLVPGDAVTVVLKETRHQASAAEIRLLEPRRPARELRRQIKAAGDEIRDEVNRPITILLVGRTGVGKSSTINTLLGVDWAIVGDHEPETAEIHAFKGKIDGTDVRVIDTPGFCDDHTGKGNDARYLRQMVEFAPEIDLMLFASVLDDTRVRADEIHALELLTKFLGEGVWEKAVVVFTRADRVQRLGYEAQRDGRFAAFRRRLRQIAPSAGSVPFVAVSNTKARTPDRRLWFPALWIACLERMTDTGFEPFLLSTVRRLESVEPRRADHKGAFAKPATTYANPNQIGAGHASSGDSPDGSPLATKQSGASSPAKAKRSSGSTTPRATSVAGSSSTSNESRTGRSHRLGSPPGPTDRGARPALPSIRTKTPAGIETHAKSTATSAEASRPGELVPPVVTSVTRRQQGGVPIVETTFSSARGRGAIVINGDRATVVQKIVQRRAPNILRTILKAGIALLPKIKRIFGI